jgi:hypothetical protein
MSGYSDLQKAGTIVMGVVSAIMAYQVIRSLARANVPSRSEVLLERIEQRLANLQA